jgi:hypothetical protein
MTYCLEQYDLEESKTIFQISSAKVAALGQGGAAIGEWIEIITSIIVERHPEDTLAVRHALNLYKMGQYVDQPN